MQCIWYRRLMNRIISLIFIVSISIFGVALTPSKGDMDYFIYHRKTILAEELIVNEKFQEALDIYASIFEYFDFVFIREFKISAQLAIITNDNLLAIKYLKLGIKNGWSITEIKKNNLLSPLLSQIPKSEITDLITSYNKRINISLKNEVQELMKIDQKMAVKALFRIGQKSKIRYNEQKFAPHSECQLTKLIEIFETNGFPSERLIGNSYWVSTILSHHNSISPAYNRKDTLFNYIKPKLFQAIKDGQMSPYEYALIDNWKIASESNHNKSSYGFLEPNLDNYSLITADNLRAKIGLRSIELRNALVEIQTKYDIDLFLPGRPWQDGKIIVDSKT